MVFLALAVIHPVDKVLPPRFNMLLIQELQRTVAPEIFSPKGVYGTCDEVLFGYLFYI